jgi:DNA-binding IclR family transcriptional regulator
VSRGEFKEGAIAVAVPVFKDGECAASLTIAGPSERCDNEGWVRRATRLLRVAATEMSAELAK